MCSRSAGVVEVQLGGEAEPVAQRAGQQAGPGGGADQGERAGSPAGSPSRRGPCRPPRRPGSPPSRGRASPRPGGTSGGSRRGRTPRPRLSPDRMAARSPACWMAGPLEIRSGADISAAMIMARVVLPSPGGPDSSTWSGTRAAVPGRLQHQAELLADPRLAVELGQAWSAAAPTRPPARRARRRVGTSGVERPRRSAPGCHRRVSPSAPGVCSAARISDGDADLGPRRPGARPRRRRPRRPGPTSRAPAGPG